MERKKIIIIHSTPVNSGDQLLLQCTYDFLKEKYGEIDLEVWTNRLKLLSQIKRAFTFKADLDQLIFDSRQFKHVLWIKRILFYFGFFKLFLFLKILHTKEERERYKMICSVDLVLSSGGSYLNDFYHCRPRLIALNIIATINKSLVLLPQSFGPFEKERTKDLIKETLKKIPHVYVRDRISQNILSQLGINHSRYCPDLAFFHANKDVEKPFPDSKKVLMNFRKFTQNIDNQYVIEIASSLIKLLRGFNFEIYLISTCQGVKEYIDDSEFAELVYDRLDNTSGVHLIRTYFSCEDYLNKAQEFDLYIGMRLHGALMAMINGVPSFCLGYEHKSKAIYASLGLEAFEKSLKYSSQEILMSVRNFMDTSGDLREKIPSVILRQKEELAKTLKFPKI